MAWMIADYGKGSLINNYKKSFANLIQKALFNTVNGKKLFLKTPGESAATDSLVWGADIVVYDKKVTLERNSLSLEGETQVEIQEIIKANSSSSGGMQQTHARPYSEWDTFKCKILMRFTLAFVFDGRKF